MPTDPFALRVLSLNIWDLPLVSKHVTTRMNAIGKQLARMNLDVVALQEAWMGAHRRRVVEHAASGGLAYSHYFASGLRGSGLMLLSRFPIVDADFRRFRLGGRPERVWEADFYGGKGVGFARVLTPGGPLDVYDLHAVASFTAANDDENRYYRAADLYECARFTWQSREHPALCCGDFNTSPAQREYAFVPVLARMRDAYREVHGGAVGVTFPGGSRCLDYVMVRDGQTQRLRPASAEIAMTSFEPGPGEAPIGYSDHYGVLVELNMAERQAPAAEALEDGQAVKQVLANLLEDLRRGMHSARRRERRWALSGAAGLGALVLLKRVRVPAALWASLAAGLALYAVPDEMRALDELAREIEQQLQARRAFNGATWEGE